MANHKSAAKRARQTVKRTARNRSQVSESRTAIKAIRGLIEAKDKAKATEALPRVQGLLDKLSKVGVIKAGTAARKVGRLASQITKL